MSTVDTKGALWRSRTWWSPHGTGCRTDRVSVWVFRVHVVVVSRNTGKGGDVVSPMTLTFAVTWDYRCPFARNVYEHLLTGLAAGADWQVRYLPFSLGQAHVEDGQPSVWEKPEQDSGILALQAGVVVRDDFPYRLSAVHRALFAARHDEGRSPESIRVLRWTRYGPNTSSSWCRTTCGACRPSSWAIRPCSNTPPS